MFYISALKNSFFLNSFWLLMNKKMSRKLFKYKMASILNQKMLVLILLHLIFLFLSKHCLAVKTWKTRVFPNPGNSKLKLREYNKGGTDRQMALGYPYFPEIQGTDKRTDGQPESISEVRLKKSILFKIFMAHIYLLAILFFRLLFYLLFGYFNTLCLII